MKVSRPDPYLTGVAAQPAPCEQAPVSRPGESAGLDFTAVYDRHFDDVLRWLRALGGPDADLEDLAQEVFVVVRRKLAHFTGGNLPGWLYTIAKLTVRDRTSRAWFRRILHRRGDVEPDDVPSGTSDPEALLEARENQRLFYRLASHLSARRREAFLLYEIEGYSGEEIAALLGVPVGTVWTRLHHARKDFVAEVRALMEKEAR